MRCFVVCKELSNLVWGKRGGFYVGVLWIMMGVLVLFESLWRIIKRY